MAVMRNGEEDVYLRALHVLGRNPAKADTRLANSDASQIHAVISWNGSIWEITDLSRNGTFVDGHRLPPNVKTALLPGQRIRCARESDSVWHITDLSAPVPLLQPVGADRPALILKQYQLLPDAAIAAAAVHFSPSGHWMFDDHAGTRVLHDGDLIEAGNTSWRLLLPAPPGWVTDLSGNPAPAMVWPTFEFLVSQNEEHIRLSARYGSEQIDFGERVHHYSLLTLARSRYADFQRGLDESTQGWVSVERLSKMLGIDASHLNIQLFRARSQIMSEQRAHGHLPDVIERRRGEVRLSAYPFRITRGVLLEAQFDCRSTAQLPCADLTA